MANNAVNVPRVRSAVARDKSEISRLTQRRLSLLQTRFPVLGGVLEVDIENIEDGDARD